MIDPVVRQRIQQELEGTRGAMQRASQAERDFLLGKFAALLLAQYPRLTAPTVIQWARETWNRSRKEMTDATINPL